MYAIGMTSGYVRYACPCARFKTLFIYQSALADVQKLLNQHKYPTHCSSACSTLIAQILSQRGKRTLYWFINSRINTCACWLFIAWWKHKIEFLKVKYQKFIARYHKHQWALDHALSWGRNKGQRVKFINVQLSSSQISPFAHILCQAFQTRIRRRRCPGSTILLCSCAIVAKKNNKKCKRFPSPQHNLLQYWEKIVETKQ